MKESEILLVKRTWRAFRGMDPGVIGDAFYSKLFSYNPSLRKMFPGNMNQQYQKLMAMINIIIARLDNLDVLNEKISAVAHRHIQYGVRPAHYKLVGKALLWTIKQGLGSEWSPAVEAAWTKCYAILSGTMILVSQKNSLYARTNR
jgi:hemoglobin-like flavoprotein